MSALFLIWYVASTSCSAPSPTTSWPSRCCGNINVGLLIGLGQFLTTFIITGIYVRFANRELDPRAEAIRDELEGTAS